MSCSRKAAEACSAPAVGGSPEGESQKKSCGGRLQAILEGITTMEGRRKCRRKGGRKEGELT